MDYLAVLQEYGRPAETASASERALAIEVAQLRSLFNHGGCHHDVPTLRNVQVQKNKVVASALAFVDDLGDDTASLAQLIADARELRRVTGVVTT